MVAQVGSDRNHGLIAFRDEQFEPCWSDIESRAKALQHRYHIDFPRIAKKLERGEILGYVERINKASALAA